MFGRLVRNNSFREGGNLGKFRGIKAGRFVPS